MKLGLLLAPAVLSLPVHADVTLRYRFSDAAAQYIASPFDPPWAPPSWSESASTEEFGDWSITLPHGYTHADSASSVEIAGVFDANYRGGQFSPADAQRASQVVRFHNDAHRPITLRFNAHCRPCATSLPGTPNLSFELTDLGSRERVFELFRDGIAQQSGATNVYWFDQTWTTELPPGEYELRTQADYDEIEVIAGQRLADGDVTFTLGFGPPVCPADFNNDGFVDFFDYDDFVSCFETGICGEGSADFNHDGFADFFDYADFVAAFETGC